jgi:hypothetical protein
MTGSGKRAVGIAVVAAIVCVAIGLYIALYLTNVPGSSAATSGSSGGVNLYLGTVAASELTDPHPSWVSYYAVDKNDQNWRHDTTFILPANTVVHVTIYNFDGQSGLRNPFISQAQGIQGGTFQLDGKPTQAIGPDTASHIFAIPELGVSVPVYGIPDDAKNPCDNAPCPLSTAHSTTTFTFRTGAKGLYRWQCFVPCAAGFIQGFGGPMQTVGYMDGFIKVV